MKPVPRQPASKRGSSTYFNRSQHARRGTSVIESACSLTESVSSKRYIPLAHEISFPEEVLPSRPRNQHACSRNQHTRRGTSLSLTESTSSCISIAQGVSMLAGGICACLEMHVDYRISMLAGGLCIWGTSSACSERYIGFTVTKQAKIGSSSPNVQFL